MFNRESCTGVNVLDMLSLHLEVPSDVRRKERKGKSQHKLHGLFPSVCGSQRDWRRAIVGLLSAKWMQVHLHLFSTAEHPDRGVKASDRNHHLPPADDLSVSGEEHLDGHRGATVSWHFSQLENTGRVSQHFHSYRAGTFTQILKLRIHDEQFANICFF